MPVSFIHDLYSPRSRRRPEIHVDDEAAYNAPLLEQPRMVAAGAPGGGEPLLGSFEEAAGAYVIRFKNTTGLVLEGGPLTVPPLD